MKKVKEKKNLKSLVKLFILPILCFPMVANAEVILDRDITSKENFSEDIRLDRDIVIKEGAAIVANGNIKIDLNGHTINKEKEGSLTHAYYAIDVKKGSVVKLLNGSVICGSPTDSCIRNYGTLTIDNLNINSNFISVKNEEDSIITIKNSNLTSTGEHASNIQNYGTAEVSDSKLVSTGSAGAAIYNLTFGEYSSRIIAKNIIIDAPRAVESHHEGTAPTQETKNEIIIDNGTIIDNGIININSGSEVPTVKASLEVTGNVTASLEYVEYASDGAKITVNKDVAANTSINIPAGVTVEIPSNVKAENLVNNGPGSLVYDNKEELADYSAINFVMEQFAKLNKDDYTSDSFAALEEAINRVVYDLKKEDQVKVNRMAQDISSALNALVKKDTTINENPKTMNSIILYVGMGVCLIAILGFVSKKVILDN